MSEDGAVAILRWPAEERRRQRLADAGIARILVLAPDEPPPARWEPIEDWVREPVDCEELRMRLATVARRRARAVEPPDRSPHPTDAPVDLERI